MPTINVYFHCIRVLGDKGLLDRLHALHEPDELINVVKLDKVNSLSAFMQEGRLEKRDKLD
jgi:hypothetical protein